MADRQVLVGILPEVMVLDPGDQAIWLSNAGTIKIEFDPNRCPFSSNILQAPAGVRLLSGPTKPGTNAGSYRYKISLNDAMTAHGEILIRAK